MTQVSTRSGEKQKEKEKRGLNIRRALQRACAPAPLQYILAHTWLMRAATGVASSAEEASSPATLAATVMVPCSASGPCVSVPTCCAKQYNVCSTLLDEKGRASGTNMHDQESTWAMQCCLIQPCPCTASRFRAQQHSARDSKSRPGSMDVHEQHTTKQMYMLVKACV